MTETQVNQTPSPWHSIVEGVALVAVYVAAARVGLRLDAVGGFATVVWPPTGLAIAALVLRGPRLWPAVWIGAFVANVVSAAHVGVVAGIATGNTLEALAAWALLRRMPEFNSNLGTVKSVVQLAVSALGATAVSASIGVGCVVGFDLVDGVTTAEIWRSWWLGDVLGALVVTPLLLTWLAPLPDPPPLHEVAFAAAAVVVGSAVAFGSTNGARPYMLFPLLLIPTVRFGPRGATLAIFFTSAVAVAATTAGMGPFFVAGQLRNRLTELQVFMAFTSVTFLVTGALAAESRRRRQEGDAAREEAERASARKTDLLRAVSHELRTPIAALRLQLERMKITDDENDKASLLARMSVQTRRLQTLIEALLAQGRLQSGKLPVQRADIDVTQIVVAAVEEFMPQAEANGLALVCKLGGPALVSTDPQLLRLVLANLIGNAVKYTSEGSVTVLVRTVADAVVVDVKDTGPGIAPADQQRIFEPFEQLAGTKGVVGVGLGLSLARDLTRALGGRLELQSAVGAGSTFSVFLPTTTETTTRENAHG